MATQEIPSGNGIKNISVPRSSAYIKIAERNGSRLLSGRSILSIANSYQASFKFSPSLCLKLRTSFSGVLITVKGLAMTAKQAILTQDKRQRKEGE